MNYDSKTDYLVWVSRYTQKVIVFTGKQGDWELIKTFPCSTGANNTPTPVGILQSMCSTGVVSFGRAIPVILGQNIGTCVSVMMGAIGANKNARRTRRRRGMAGALRLLQSHERRKAGPPARRPVETAERRRIVCALERPQPDLRRRSDTAAIQCNDFRPGITKSGPPLCAASHPIMS